jgi:hypothetical protein
MSMTKEFKDFTMRGNVVDMAVGLDRCRFRDHCEITGFGCD